MSADHKRSVGRQTVLIGRADDAEETARVHHDLVSLARHLNRIFRASSPRKILPIGQLLGALRKWVKLQRGIRTAFRLASST